jgi:hypothetical protein
MIRIPWKIVQRAMLSASPLPHWARQHHVIRAFEEIAADQACGLLSRQRVWQLLAEWRFMAHAHRCLEAYEPIEAAALRDISLERLLEEDQRYTGQMSVYAHRRAHWLERLIRQKCREMGIDEQHPRYREACNAAARHTSATPFVQAA